MKAGCAWLCIAALGAVTPLWASGRWVSLGPDGASVHALALQPGAPRVVYAGTEIGLFKSTDRGITWSAADHGLRALGSSWVKAIAVDPAAPSTLYAGLISGGVCKSTDGGATWAAARQGLPQTAYSAVFALAVDPHAHRTVFAATGAGLFKTADGGAHWRRMGRGAVAASAAQALALVPSQPATLYAGVDAVGVFKSVDGGATWRAVSAGPMASRTVLALAVDPRSAGTLWAATTTGFLRSTDGGARWDLLAGSPGAIVTLVPSPAVPGLLWAGALGGLFRSADGGTTWTAADSGLTDRQVLALAADPTAAGVVYAGTFGKETTGGVFKTVDGGATWAFRSRGLRGSSAVAFAVAPGAGGDLWLGTSSGELFHSPDAGAGWLQVTRPRPDALSFGAIAVDPRDAATVYVTSQANGPLFKTADGGATWRLLGDHQVQAGALALDPTAPTTLYTGSFGIFKSVDGGAGWTRLPVEPLVVRQIVLAPSSPQTVYAGGSILMLHGAGPPTLLRSTDGGAHWAYIGAGLPLTGSYALAVHPQDASTLYVAAAGGIYRSLNGGDTWELAAAGGTNAPVKLLLATDGTLYGAFQGQTVRASMDGGASWHTLGRGLAIPAFTDLVLDPQGGRLYAALANGGLFALDL